MMNGNYIDYIIIAVYLIGIAVVGIISGGKQKSVQDYFLGSKVIPWWAICFSIVAAETSTLTFISIPGLAYLTNLNFMQVVFGYLIGRIIISFIFLPSYYKGNLKTAYTFLETRFGSRVRKSASVVFLFTRVAADGVRLFATAIPLKLMIDISYPEAIALIALIALIYTYTGGIKGIIWVDVIQMFTYIGGAVFAALFLLNIIPDGVNTFLSSSLNNGKLSVFNLGFEKSISEFFKTPYTLFGGLIGGAFLSMASHGTDQLIVQRLLAAKDLRASRKALIGSGVIVIIQFAIFMIVGVLLHTYYDTINIKSDEIFPKFIIEVLPSGIFGFIIAGLFAAALSTLAGSISSLSSSFTFDLFLPIYKKEISESRQLKLSRLFSIFWAIILVMAAIFFMNTSQSVVELALSIASFTYGGLLGTFLLGILFKNAKEKDALIGFASGIIVMTFVIVFKLVAWTWFTVVGVVITIIVGYLVSVFNRKQNL